MASGRISGEGDGDIIVVSQNGISKIFSPYSLHIIIVISNF